MKKLILASVVALATSATAGCSVVSSGSDEKSEGGKGATFADASVELFDAVEKAEGSMKGKRVAFVPILYKGYDLTTNWGHTMERALTSMGAEFKVYDSNFDTDKMVKTINDLIAKKSVDVLVLHNPDVGVLTKQIADAEKAGIYTVVVNMISNRLGDAYIGPNMFEAGRTITERMVSDCKKKGGPRGIAIVDGPGNDGLSLQWEKGVNQVAKKAGFKVVATSHTDWQDATAQKAAASIIQQHKGKLCAITSPWELNAVAIGGEVASAEARGQLKKGAVGTYSMGAGEQWCAALRAGRATATVAYDVQGVGEAAAMTATQLVQGGNPAGATKTVSFVAQTIVDKGNVDDTSIACYKGE